MMTDPTALLPGPVVAVVTLHRSETAVAVAKALVAGGVPALELNCTPAVAAAAIPAILAEVPEAVPGVGLVATPEDIDRALADGAKFLTSLGTTAATAAALAAAAVPALPGCQTVSEALALAALGFPVLRFAPAEAAGGTHWLRAVATLAPQLRFAPFGGIGPDSAPRYLALPNVAFLGATWIAPHDAIAVGDWERIEKLARAARHLPRPDVATRPAAPAAVPATAPAAAEPAAAQPAATAAPAASDPPAATEPPT